jgi:hypothetical protein
VTSIPRPLARASSSSSSALTPDQDSSDDYPDIRTDACGEPAEGSHLVLMVAPNGDWSHNNSSSYPTIGRSETSDAQTPSAGLVRNLNPDFNAIKVQTIMETIQHVAPNGSPLTALAQQGAEAANLIAIEKSAGVPRMEPSAGNNDRVRCARSEAASSVSLNHHLSEHDARRCITQNCYSDKSGGQTSLRPVKLISMTDPAILKNLFRFIRPSLRPMDVTIG